MTETKKAILYVAKNGEEGTQELEGTFQFTNGMHKPEERIFQFVALTSEGQFTLDIPLDLVMAEIRRVLRETE